MTRAAGALSRDERVLVRLTTLAKAQKGSPSAYPKLLYCTVSLVTLKHDDELCQGIKGYWSV